MLSNSPPLADLVSSNIVIVAGKGGVGKTTVTAVLARAAAERGKRVLVIELDGKPALAQLLPGLDVRHISAADALEEYLQEHGFKRIAKRLAATGVIDVVSTAAPGIDDLVVLGKIKQLERSGEFDLIVVDGPAAGHAITFLSSASGLLDSVRAGPVRTQAEDVAALLADPERCQVVLVTLPESTPVTEMIETSFALEDRVGVQLAAIVVNQVDVGPAVPDPTDVDFGRATAQVDDACAAAEFRRSRRAVQAAELARLSSELPLPQLRVRSMPAAGLTANDIVALSAMFDGEDSGDDSPAASEVDAT
ncbi:MAG TPA: ArsA family ATPase [Ilumatobacter sp.]|nr:ArsA family ATPase [Ilumatobacter sp.]